MEDGERVLNLFIGFTVETGTLNSSRTLTIAPTEEWILSSGQKNKTVLVWWSLVQARCL